MSITRIRWWKYVSDFLSVSRELSKLIYIFFPHPSLTLHVSKQTRQGYASLRRRVKSFESIKPMALMISTMLTWMWVLYTFFFSWKKKLPTFALVRELTFCLWYEHLSSIVYRVCASRVSREKLLSAKEQRIHPRRVPRVKSLSVCGEVGEMTINCDKIKF